MEAQADLSDYERLVAKGVEFDGPPRRTPYSEAETRPPRPSREQASFFSGHVRAPEMISAVTRN